MLFKKYEGNPILKPNKENEWENRCVLNPSVIYDEEMKKFVMIYRAGGNDIRHQIVFGLATSDDGFHFKRELDYPVFAPERSEADGGCVEDPRIVKIGDLYYMTYVGRAYAPGRYWLEPWVEGVSKPPMYLDNLDIRGEIMPELIKDNTSATYLAVTKDFIHYKKFGRITEANVDNRDVYLFPELIDNKFVVISRPKFKDKGLKMPSIFISKTEDPLVYNEPKLLMTGETNWEVQRIGGGTPPIKTEKGWLMFYHGVDKNGTYRVGIVLLDLNNPEIILKRTKDYIMEPDQDYEKSGIYDGCVFPTAAVLKDGVIYMYYGCADEYVSVATCKLKDVLDYLETI